MPLTTDTQVQLACLEYRRDPDFRELTDRTLSSFRYSGQVDPSLTLEQALALDIPGVGILAKALLDTYHRNLRSTQWARLASLPSSR
jgi:hypothetical protein